MLEKDVDPVEDVGESQITIIDGMAVVQKAHFGDNTFGQLSESILQTMVNLGSESDVIHAVFDVYRDKSIKNDERLRRGEGSLVFQNLLPEQPVKQWKSFLRSSQNKRESS
jgi:hypothetical protein